MVKIYLPAKFWWNISIHGWDKTTSGFGKRTAAILEFYFDFDVCVVIVVSFYICLPNFVVIGRSAAELWRHTDFSRWRPSSPKCTHGFIFSERICLRRWKSICLPNCDEISHSTAEIKLLPVSENGRPSYWNSISGFHFDVCIVIGMSFYICLPNFVVIGRSAAELWRHIEFLKMAAIKSEIYFRIQI